VNCPSCGHENPDHAKFCMQCAAPLARRCTQCGSELASGARFCVECAAPVAAAAASPERDPRSYTPNHLVEKILTTRSALEGERKQVTVLFADVKGSMELAKQVDAEEWHRILDRFFQILADGVHRFEGTINQYTGDGIMALFGAPIAHEDHAQRACYAALHLRDELRRYADELRLSRGLNFSVRMGLNSGEVVVGKIGDDLRMDYTAQGYTVGLAARMQQIAAADHAYLTGQTARVVEGFFQLRDLGPTQVPGIERPVDVHELEGTGPLRTRFEVSRKRGLSRFVGRAGEMAVLEAALEHTIAGQGQAVGVVGEAGVGKSRLCYEFTEHCRARGIVVREVHGVSHGKKIPFLPVLEFLRSYFGIAEQDGEETARDKIAGRVVRLDSELSEALPLLFDFLGVPDPAHPASPMDSEIRERQLLGVIRRLVYARSQRESAVFCFEDLHWLDAGSETLLEQLVESVPDTRTLLVVNFRPGYQAAWMGKSYYQQLPLRLLGAEDVAELLVDLLGTHSSLADLGERIGNATEGNPFFVEEMVQALVETGNLEGTRRAYRLVQPIEGLRLPATVQAVLAARIDRLAEREKQVLGTASVIGRRFSEPLLRRVVDLPESELAAALRSLVAGEFLYEEALYPEAEYLFKHALTQEVAYGSQLAERRKRIHAAVAGAVEELHPHKLDELSALLAHHWEEAGETLEAARWHRRAAAWAGLSHVAEALRHWRRVRDLLDGIPECPETLALGLEARCRILSLGVRSGMLTEDASRLFAEGENLVARGEDPRGRIQLLQTYGVYRSYEGRVQDGVEALREAKRLADELQDAELRAVVGGSLHFGLFFTGPFSEALATIEEILELTTEDPSLGRVAIGMDPQPLWLAFRGIYLGALGQCPDGARELERALAQAHPRGDIAALTSIETLRALLGVWMGDGPLALAHARRALELAERTGAANVIGASYFALGSSCILEERWADALEALERATERGVGYNRLTAGPDLALAWLGLGNERKARSEAEKAVSSATRSGAKAFALYAEIALARVLRRTKGRPARAEIENALSRAHALMEDSGFRIREPHICIERAELLGVLGDEPGRLRELREAHRLFTEMGATGHAKRVATELGLPAG
jgi:class 3 adenylate cyclase/tetratricopeptide (TPR) repeat protein